MRLLGPLFAAEQRNAVAPDDGNEWRVKTPPGGVHGGLPAAATVTSRSGNQGEFMNSEKDHVSRLHRAARTPGLDLLFPPRVVDYEDRPYHLGWLLHAWPAERAARWNERATPQ